MSPRKPSKAAIQRAELVAFARVIVAATKSYDPLLPEKLLESACRSQGVDPERVKALAYGTKSREVTT